MAKDLDFRRKTDNQPPAPAARPAVRPTPQKPPKNSSGRSRNWWPLGVLLCAAALGGVYYYYQTLGTTNVKELSVATPTATSQATVAATPTTNPSVTATTTADPNAVPIIQIYDGGAGAAVVDQIIATLSTNKFEAEKLGTAQLEYAKTYIYYRAAFETQAQAIGKLMPTRDVVLRTTVIDGAFDILIYAGKK